MDRPRNSGDARGKPALGLLLTLAAALLVLLPAAARAQTGYHYIVGLDPAGDNFLALRSEPSTRSGRRIAKLGPATLLAPTGARSGRWMHVAVVNTGNAGLTGWVHDGYVGCCSGAAPAAAAGGYGRVAHPSGAALNMRAGPSLDAPVVGTIPSGTRGVPVSDCIYESEVRSWCAVTFRGRNGWVSTRYFFRD